MEEEEDDFYGGKQERESGSADDEPDVKDEKMEMSDDQEEEEEDDDSDDDVQFTLEKPKGATEPTPGARSHTKQTDRSISIEQPKPTKTSTSIKQESQRPSSIAPSTTSKETFNLTHSGREGKDFPEIRTSTLEVNGTPTWPANGKPITEVDIDADLAEHSKPWRLPGTDQTDYFNYGFDEYTWTQYCVRQQTMAGTISDQKQADAQMKALFGGGAGGAAGGGPPAGMPGMPPGMGMPDPDQMMQMVSQGIIPPEFAQMMQMGGMPGMPGPGQNSVSPGPQGGGFQPPTGPSGGGMQGQQGGFGQGMDGYSPQQMAIMQQEQHGQMQGGGGRGRGRRGRGGFY